MISNSSEKKALVIDKSGINPWVFSIEKNDILADDLCMFIEDAGIDCYFSQYTKKEFSTCNYVAQPSLFAKPLNVATIQNYEPIYLSDAAYFSGTSSLGSNLRIVPCEAKQVQAGLWEASDEWKLLSEEDRSVIKTANSLMNEYQGVTILTNDWPLRQQCELYEGIVVKGTCSMLAGFALAGYITIQRGVSIFNKWRSNEPRWIPGVYEKKRFLRKYTFGEILELERQRQKINQSFWVKSSRQCIDLK